MATQTGWTTARVCKAFNVQRTFLQHLIKHMGIRPRQEIRHGRRVNLYTVEQVEKLKKVLTN